MSLSNGFDDDEYVAKLLAEDAKKSSIRYSTHGIQALLPRRPTTAAPRPNTRFLKSIVREADSHNAALKKKEELEARMRLKRIKDGRPAFTDHSHFEDTRSRKRRRCSPEDDTERRRQEWDDDRRNTSSERSKSRDRRHHGTRRDRDRRPEHGYHRRSRGDEKKRSRRSQSRNQESSMEDDVYSKMRSKPSQHTKPRRRRSLEGSAGSESQSDSGYRIPQSSRKYGHITDGSKPSGSKAESRRAQEARRSARASSESDPLETLVGPLDPPKEKHPLNDPPPVRSRGRGAYKPSAAAMDAHFSADYNPNLDLHPESEVEDEKEDWDMALEAHRDREMFKQKHAERLREAGFGDAEIKKWEDSGKEKDIEDVQWSGKGQAREWDVGKVQQDSSPAKSNGSGTEAAWRRKDGGFLKQFRGALG